MKEKPVHYLEYIAGAPWGKMTMKALCGATYPEGPLNREIVTFTTLKDRVTCEQCKDIVFNF